ncbi:hypothetical protein Trydic_g14855 [Trypoxylus dichotomus]
MSFMVQPCDIYDRENQCRSHSLSSSSDHSDYSFYALRRKWSNFTRSNFCSCNRCSRPNGKTLSGVFGVAWVSNRPRCCNEKPSMSLDVQYLNANPQFVKNKVGEILETFKTQCTGPVIRNATCECTQIPRNPWFCNDTFCYNVGDNTSQQKSICCDQPNPHRKLRCCKPICCDISPSESKRSKPLLGTKTVCTCICGDLSQVCGCVCSCRKKIIVNKLKLVLLIVFLIVLYLALAYYFELVPFQHKCNQSYSFFTKTKHIRH